MVWPLMKYYVAKPRKIEQDSGFSNLRRPYLVLQNHSHPFLKEPEFGL